MRAELLDLSGRFLGECAIYLLNEHCLAVYETVVSVSGG